MLQKLKKMNLKKIGALMMAGLMAFTSIGVVSANAFNKNQNVGNEKAGVMGEQTGNNVDAGNSSNLVDYIKKAINYVLGFLFIVSFVILLYGGFQMLTAAGDDSKFKKGFKIVKTTAGGLLFIALSWAIVQVIFAGLGSLGGGGGQ